jgi:hypothetical protein
VLPALPGRWGLKGAILYQEPLDWVLRYVVMQTWPSLRTFYMATGTQLLAVPVGHLTVHVSLDTPGLQLRKHRELPEDLDQAQPVMQELAQAMIAEAVPFFAEAGTLHGQLLAAEADAMSNALNCHHHERLCYIRLLLGDVAGALTAAEAAEQTGQKDGRGWALELAQRARHMADLARDNPEAAIDALRQNAEWTRTKLRLPPSR